MTGADPSTAASAASAAGPTAVPALAALQPYSPPRHLAPVDLVLSGNEGDHPPATLLTGLAGREVDLLRTYPSQRAVESALARQLEIEPDRVFVGAGGDEVIDRICRAYLAPGRHITLPEPTFVMFAHYATLAGATIDKVPWPEGPYPLEAVLQTVRPETAVITVVTPNNPTGAVATTADLRRVAEAAPHALLLVDLAYTEYADEDLTAVALELPNAIVVRTVSKAWGLAGLRVGYGAGPAALLAPLRAAGGPFSVSGLSLAIAARALGSGDDRKAAHTATVHAERRQLQTLLRELDVHTPPSQGNFALLRLANPTWLRDGLAGLGIAVRVFPGCDGLEDAARITCPGDPDAFERVCHALRTTLRPQALLFDMDGVLADVSRSYRHAITLTAADFGVAVTAAGITAIKAAGGANNDWEVTHRLVKAGGGSASLEAVTKRFEELYQGTQDQPGLHRNETLLPTRPLLERLAAHLPLAVVTGRPRVDAERFLHDHGLTKLFPTVVCLEDAALKPDPAPVRLALERLGVERAWLLGDTPDDIRAARAARVVPIGVAAPDDRGEETNDNLLRAGAARVVDTIDEIEELLQ